MPYSAFSSSGTSGVRLLLLLVVGDDMSRAVVKGGGSLDQVRACSDASTVSVSVALVEDWSILLIDQVGTVLYRFHTAILL